MGATQRNIHTIKDTHMSIRTSTCIHQASKVIIEATTTINRRGEETKWVTLNIKGVDGRKELELTVFDLELKDVFLVPSDAKGE
jgi:hypothetical protein